MLERLAELMHQEWLALMAEQGYHPPPFCPNSSVGDCPKCRGGLLPWSTLTEEVKEVNRRGVGAVLREANIIVGVAEAERDKLRGLLQQALHALTAGGTLEQHGDAAAIRAAAGWGSPAREGANDER